MDYIKIFKQGNWLKTAGRFVSEKSKLTALAVEAAKYASEKESLYEAKSDFIVFCDYVKDVATGRYKGYKVWNLTVVVAAIIYVLSPIDIVPDFLLGGFIDDISIIGWAISKVGKELKAYREYRRALPPAAPPVPTPPTPPEI